MSGSERDRLNKTLAMCHAAHSQIEFGNGKKKVFFFFFKISSHLLHPKPSVSPCTYLLLLILTSGFYALLKGSNFLVTTLIASFHSPPPQKQTNTIKTHSILFYLFPCHLILRTYTHLHSPTHINHQNIHISVTKTNNNKKTIFI